MRCHRIATLALIGLLGIARMTGAANLVVVISDGAGEGFNDPTLGAARTAAFLYTMNLWATALPPAGPDIVINAQMNPLGGDAFSAILGFAGPASYHSGFAGSIASTAYAAGLANHISGVDLNGGLVEINCTFNSDVDDAVVLGPSNFYYGTDANPGSLHIDFPWVVLHELGHGLGFTAGINTDGTYQLGIPKIFDRQLTNSAGVFYPNLTQTERANGVNGLDFVFFRGPEVVTVFGATGLRIYAPAPFAPGSSMSHWHGNNSGAVLMRPFYPGPPFVNHDVDATLEAFVDIGWPFPGPTAAGDWSLFE